jgi:SAM-dependent methyltransferase
LFVQVLPTSGGRVLDVGAGPAVHSIELAARGHHVVAIDAVPEARSMALRLAAKRGVAIDYRVADALHEPPEGPFDLVLDRGFLHTLDIPERSTWRSVVIRALRPDGVVLLKCFDTRPLRGFGPPGLTAREIVETLGTPEPGGLGLELLRRGRFAGLLDRDHASWTAMATRIPE